MVLVGVSRSGKTPTSLYLAMQYGIKAANYPLIPEDFERGELPPHWKTAKTRYSVFPFLPSVSLKFEANAARILSTLP